MFENFSHRSLEVDGIIYLSAIGSRRVNAPNLYEDLLKLFGPLAAQSLAVGQRRRLAIGDGVSHTRWSVDGERLERRWTASALGRATPAAAFTETRHGGFQYARAVTGAS